MGAGDVVGGAVDAVGGLFFFSFFFMLGGFWGGCGNEGDVEGGGDECYDTAWVGRGATVVFAGIPQRCQLVACKRRGLGEERKGEEGIPSLPEPPDIAFDVAGYAAVLFIVCGELGDFLSAISVFFD